MLFCKTFHDTEFFFELRHKYAIVLRRPVIHIKAYEIYIRIARIAFAVFFHAFRFTARPVFVEYIMDILCIPQIFHGIAVYILICLRVTECCAPPEPASGIFMERAEQHGAFDLLCIVRDHIQISGIHFVVFPARQDLVHGIVRRIIRRISGKIIFCIRRLTALVVRIFFYSCKIRHMGR